MHYIQTHSHPFRFVPGTCQSLIKEYFIGQKAIILMNDVLMNGDV